MATYRALLSLKSSLDDPDSRLSALSSLRLLNLSNNVFNRTFPPELSNLTNLRVLDLYNNNHLTGVLPVSHKLLFLKSEEGYLIERVRRDNMDLRSAFVHLFSPKGQDLVIASVEDSRAVLGTRDEEWEVCYRQWVICDGVSSRHLPLPNKRRLQSPRLVVVAKSNGGDKQNAVVKPSSLLFCDGKLAFGHGSLS
ncbi:hypothetical protein ACLB2K_022357 [Fragaria x ananassa]